MQGRGERHCGVVSVGESVVIGRLRVLAWQIEIFQHGAGARMPSSAFRKRTRR